MLKTPDKIICDSIKHPAPQHGIGIVKGNPKFCAVQWITLSALHRLNESWGRK